MAVGRPPKPTNVHLLNGNPSKLKKKDLDARVDIPVEIPEPPSHLSPSALAEWHRISPELEKMQVVSMVDRAALAAYCSSYSIWEIADNKIQSLGEAGMVVGDNELAKVSPWMRVRSSAIIEMHKFLIEFGFSPSSRSRVMGAAKKAAPEEEKSIKRFFNN